MKRQSKILAVVRDGYSPDGVLAGGDLGVLEKDEEGGVFGGPLQEGDGDDAQDGVVRCTRDNIRGVDGGGG